MTTIDLENILMVAEEALAALGPGTENEATLAALRLARTWQDIRRARMGAPCAL